MAEMVAAEGVKPQMLPKSGSLPVRVDEEKGKGRVAGGIHLPPVLVPKVPVPQPVQARANATSATGSGKTTRTTSSASRQTSKETRRVGK